MKNQKKIQLFLSAIILFAISVPGICIFVKADKSYSENENRYLKSRPQISLDSFLSANFQKDSDTWLSDQFPGRNDLKSLGALLMTGIGKKDIDGVYIGKDGFLFEKKTPQDIDSNLYKSNLDRIKKLADTYKEISVSMLLVPSSGCILDNKLPDNAKMYDYKSLINNAGDMLDNVSVIDPSEVLSSLGEEAYYKTDHHWTTKAALSIFLTFFENNDSKQPDYNLEKVTSDFLGSLHSKTLLPGQAKDSIYILPAMKNLNAVADGNTINVLETSALNQKDKYQVFFGGNHGLTQINGKGEGNVLILKDSFANCFVPFLTYKYKNISMIDLRYFPGTINSYISENNINEIIVIYQIDNFAEDTNLSKIFL